MKKAKNRRERIDFLEQKMGKDILPIISKFTDKEIKNFYEMQFLRLKDKKDYIEFDFGKANYHHNCLRCGEEIEHSFECACGTNNVVFSEDDWYESIQGLDDDELTEKDREFKNNGYKMKKGAKHL